VDFLGATMNLLELEIKAQECEQRAKDLEGILYELNTRAAPVFASWTGAGAQSVVGAMADQVGTVLSAHSSLSAAALTLRKGAQEIKDYLEAVRRAEEEQRKREEQRRLAEAQRPQTGV